MGFESDPSIEESLHKIVGAVRDLNRSIVAATQAMVAVQLANGMPDSDEAPVLADAVTQFMSRPS